MKEFLIAAVISTIIIFGMVSCENAAKAQDNYRVIVPGDEGLSGGARISIEEGVRVFRPYPATKKQFFIPSKDFPLALSFQETQVTEHSYNYHEHNHKGEGAVRPGGTPGLFVGRLKGHGHKGGKK